MTEASAPGAPQALLAAVDFSPSSRRALDLCLAWRGEAEVTALHVVDSEFAGRIQAHGLGGSAEVIAKLRERAGEEFDWLTEEKGAATFSPMIVEGIPFVEIVRIASDLEVDLIVMGMHRAAPRLDQLLFGSTAERVLRTSRIPVLCVP